MANASTRKDPTSANAIPDFTSKTILVLVSVVEFFENYSKVYDVFFFLIIIGNPFQTLTSVKRIPAPTGLVSICWALTSVIVPPVTFWWIPAFALVNFINWIKLKSQSESYLSQFPNRCQRMHYK